jgi:hypothetical protein
MKLPGHDELANVYRSASEAELLEIAGNYDSLTPAAQGVLRAEFDRRGLQPPEVPDASPVATYQRLVTIRQYRDLSEAQVARGVLESAGIACYLRDENAVRLEWVWSNLLGGVRLQVRDEDREAAEEILTQPIPEQIPLDENEHFDQPRCPSCSSLDIHFQAIHERLGMASVLAFYPISLPKRAWICASCRAEWRDDADSTESRS